MCIEYPFVEKFHEVTVFYFFFLNYTKLIFALENRLTEVTKI